MEHLELKETISLRFFLFFLTFITSTASLTFGIFRSQKQSTLSLLPIILNHHRSLASLPTTVHPQLQQ